MSQVWALDTVLTNTNAIQQPLLHMLFCRLDLPGKLYAHLNWALLFCLICHTPIENRGLSVDPLPFPTVLTMKTSKKRPSHVPFMLSDIILAQWRRLVASKALDLLHQTMRTVTYRCIAMGIKTTSFVGVFVDWFLFACCPGGRWGNTEQVVPAAGVQWLPE